MCQTNFERERERALQLKHKMKISERAPFAEIGNIEKEFEMIKLCEAVD